MCNVDICLTSLLLIFVSFLLHEEDENLSEDLDKVDEKVEGVSNKVFVSTASLLYDNLGIKHDKSTEDGDSKIQVSLEQKLRSEENVDECQEHQG